VSGYAARTRSKHLNQSPYSVGQMVPFGPGGLQPEDDSVAHRITVRPYEVSWVVLEDGRPDVAAFGSGAAAERLARIRGDRWRRQGEAAEVEIYLRGGGLAARLVFDVDPDLR